MYIQNMTESTTLSPSEADATGKSRAEISHHHCYGRFPNALHLLSPHLLGGRKQAGTYSREGVLQRQPCGDASELSVSLRFTANMHIHSSETHFSPV